MKASAFDNFNEDAQGVLDFARCQRPDGSYYGTSGTCRKGSPVSAKEKKELQVRASKGDKSAMKKLNELRAQGKIGKEPGFEPGAKSGTASSGINKPTTDKQREAARAEQKKLSDRAAAARKIATNMKPKVKELDRRAKDLNKEADRLERAFRQQAKLVQKSPTKENKARLKLIQRETRMADRAAKQADRAANKASTQMEKALRRALR